MSKDTGICRARGVGCGLLVNVIQDALNDAPVIKEIDHERFAPCVIQGAQRVLPGGAEL